MISQKLNPRSHIPTTPPPLRLCLGCFLLALIINQLNLSYSALFEINQNNSDTSLFDVTPSVMSTHTTPPEKHLQPVHVLIGLCGNHTGFMEELEVALKSVLVNAPLDRNMTVHLMVDEPAFDALDSVFNRTEVGMWRTRNQISIASYNVQPYFKEWKKKIRNVTGLGPRRQDESFKRHTLGAWYRLFAKEVLPSSVASVIYMDTDVVVLSNLDKLWRIVDPQYAFQWGESRCSGFMIFNVEKIEMIWDRARKINLLNFTAVHNFKFDDQMVLRAVDEIYPGTAGLLSTEWDISIADGMWLHSKNLLDVRPKAAMIHFNGGGSSKNAYFKEHVFMKDNPDFANTFGIAKYYVNLPWTWARFMAASMTKDGPGYLVQIHHRDKTDENGVVVGNNETTGARKSVMTSGGDQNMRSTIKKVSWHKPVVTGVLERPGREEEKNGEPEPTVYGKATLLESVPRDRRGPDTKIGYKAKVKRQRGKRRPKK